MNTADVSTGRCIALTSNLGGNSYLQCTRNGTRCYNGMCGQHFRQSLNQKWDSRNFKGTILDKSEDWNGDKI
jgi:hypothetical protein